MISFKTLLESASGLMTYNEVLHLAQRDGFDLTNTKGVVYGTEFGKVPSDLKGTGWRYNKADETITLLEPASKKQKVVYVDHNGGKWAYLETWRLVEVKQNNTNPSREYEAAVKKYVSSVYRLITQDLERGRQIKLGTVALVITISSPENIKLSNDTKTMYVVERYKGTVAQWVALTFEQVKQIVREQEYPVIFDY